MYWDKVLNEVLNKNTLRLFTLKPYYHKKEIKTNYRRIRGMYKLGGKFNDIYFTRREAECMVQLLNGKTMRGAAEILNLSVRTVEFYVKNMYKKLNCHSKAELIDLVLQSDFLNSIDF